MSSKGLRKDISDYFHPLQNKHDLDLLLENIGDASYVLLGEASHGTHEYYTWRAQISKRLIQEKGFSFIAVEGDWPDCFRINEWIKGANDSTVQDVMRQFKRWPTWMWANWEVAAFATWLKEYNQSLNDDSEIGFYGLDVYSLWESMEILVQYLEKEDPETAELARETLTCFEPYREHDSYASIFNRSGSDCQEEVVKLLQEVRKRSENYDTELEADLNAELNSLVMANAEKYYKAMSHMNGSSWNVRDRHMMESLNKLMDYHGEQAKVIVWEHNTHIGDARATDMNREGLINLGQLVREEKGYENTFLVGFGSYEGSVIAGSHWGAPMKEMDVPPATEGSFEHKIHEISGLDHLLIFDEHPVISNEFSESIGHRAIGVIYNPENENYNYVASEMTERYDAFLYLEKTQALHPFIFKPRDKFIPDTYPFGI